MQNRSDAQRSGRTPPVRALLLAMSLAVPTWTAVASATTIRVPDEVETLTAAVERAQAGDTLLVGPGRYVGTLRMPSGVACIAPAGPDSTIIDGGGEGPVITFEQSDAGTLLDGFSVTGGLLTEKKGYGAGILCRQHATPRINNNHITGNRAIGREGRGGGIACVDGSDAIISNNRIEGNEAAWGGGIYIGKHRGWASSPIVSANRIERNRARLGGGGVAITHTSEPLLTSNVIAWNVSLEEGGGGLYIARGQPVIQENTLWANADSAGVAAAICMVDYAAPTIDHNLIAAHRAAPAIRCVDQLRERQFMTCNNVWNREAGDFSPGCMLYPGNISADPRCCDPEAGDFGLKPSSPCLSAEECDTIGAQGIGCQE